MSIKILKSADVPVGENAKAALTSYNNVASDLLLGDVYAESLAMAKYALSNGFEVEPRVIEQLHDLQAQVSSRDQSVAKKLADTHQQLARIVRPATPRAIYLLDKEKVRQPPFYFLGPVPLIRRLSGAAVLFLSMLLLVSLNPVVNVNNIQLGLLNSENNTLFLNQLFILCCAGLGATFAALFLANRFIADANYDPRYDSTYWSRIILGVIAGMIIVELLPASLFQEGNMRNFGKPSLAMFGGFSANVVYRIIERIVDSLETLVKGNNKFQKNEAVAVAQAQASEQKTAVNAEVAAKLVDLRNQMESLDSKDATSKMNAVIQELLQKRR